MSESFPENLRMPRWYDALKKFAFPTRFVPIPPEVLALLAKGEAIPGPEQPHEIKEMIDALRAPLKKIPGNCFASVDCCSPTDTERFALKRGATYSARSTWNFLARSAKVREAALRGDVENVCLRPFRRITKPREFRLFIRERQLVAMSQYHLIRHFRRLDGERDAFWNRAEKFVSKVIGDLEPDTFVMDIYFTSGRDILVIDLNPWGPPTDPLLLQSWDRDWSTPAGLVLMEPPVQLTGEVNVSF